MTAAVCGREGCDRSLEGKRCGAKFCSAKCRQAAYAERQELAARSQVDAEVAARVARARALDKAALDSMAAHATALRGELNGLFEVLGVRPGAAGAQPWLERSKGVGS